MPEPVAKRKRSEASSDATASVGGSDAAEKRRRTLQAKAERNALLKEEVFNKLVELERRIDVGRESIQKIQRRKHPALHASATHLLLTVRLQIAELMRQTPPVIVAAAETAAGKERSASPGFVDPERRLVQLKDELAGAKVSFASLNMRVSMNNDMLDLFGVRGKCIVRYGIILTQVYYSWTISNARNTDKRSVAALPRDDGPESRRLDARQERHHADVRMHPCGRTGLERHSPTSSN